MVPPTLVSCTPYQIVITWLDETLDTQTGRDPIIYYEVDYKPTSTASWTALTSYAINGKITTYTHNVATMFAPNTYVYY